MFEKMARVSESDHFFTPVPSVPSWGLPEQTRTPTQITWPLYKQSPLGRSWQGSAPQSPPEQIAVEFLSALIWQTILYLSSAKFYSPVHFVPSWNFQIDIKQDKTQPEWFVNGIFLLLSGLGCLSLAINQGPSKIVSLLLFMKLPLRSNFPSLKEGEEELEAPPSLLPSEPDCAWVTSPGIKGLWQWDRDHGV